MPNMTGSLFGTSSFAVSASVAKFAPSAATASYAVTASYVPGVATASYALSALTASYVLNVDNGSGLTTMFTQSVAAATWSFVHNMNTRTPLVQTYDSSYNQIQPSYVLSSDGSTVEIGFGIATAGYAVISTGGTIYVTGSNEILNQTVAATTWSFNHSLNTKYPVFQVFNSNDEAIIPAGIKAVSSGSALIYFSTATAGKAVASVGGAISGSGGGTGAGFPYSGSAEITGSLAVTDKITSQVFINPQNITYDIVIPDYHNALIVGPVNVSSSISVGSGSNLLILEDQIATTGENTFVGDQIISGSLIVTSGITGSLSGTASYALTASYAMNAGGASAETASHANSGFTFASTLNKYATVASSTVGSNNVFTESTGSYRSGFYKYTVYSGSNARTGEIMAVWNGGTARYTETSTTDIGSTNAVTASVSIVSAQAQFNINTATSGWTVKSTVTYM